MVDFGTGVGKLLPNIRSLGTLLIFVIVIFALGALGYFIFRTVLKNKNEYKIPIQSWIKKNGEYCRDKKYKAKITTIDGVQFFYIKELRKTIPRGTNKQDNEYWYFIGKDGQWHNLKMGDLDFAAKRLNLNLNNLDASLANTSTRKILKASYLNENALLKYLPAIMLIGLIMIFGIVMFLIMDKAAIVMSGLNSAIEQQAKLATSNEKVVAHLDTLLSGGRIIKI